MKGTVGNTGQIYIYIYNILRTMAYCFGLYPKGYDQREQFHTVYKLYI